MPRPKKNPNIRQNEFIAAARQLFFSKGYDDTSIQDILQAVGEKSVSPSVFYYYFSSKEDIYHTVMESYIEEYMEKLERSLHDESPAVEDRFANMMLIFIGTLVESKRAIDTRNALSNRLFALDLRERIARKVVILWEEAIAGLPWLNHSADGIKSLALYITGGICELIYEFVFGQNAERQDIKALAKKLIEFSATILSVPKTIRKRFIAKVNNTL